MKDGWGESLERNTKRDVGSVLSLELKRGAVLWFPHCTECCSSPLELYPSPGTRRRCANSPCRAHLSAIDTRIPELSTQMIQVHFLSPHGPLPWVHSPGADCYPAWPSLEPGSGQEEADGATGCEPEP